MQETTRVISFRITVRTRSIGKPCDANGRGPRTGNEFYSLTWLGEARNVYSYVYRTIFPPIIEENLLYYNVRLSINIGQIRARNRLVTYWLFSSFSFFLYVNQRHRCTYIISAPCPTFTYVNTVHTANQIEDTTVYRSIQACESRIFQTLPKLESSIFIVISEHIDNNKILK